MQPDDQSQSQSQSQNQAQISADRTEQDRSARWLEENREAIYAYNRRLANASAFGDLEKLF